MSNPPEQEHSGPVTIPPREGSESQRPGTAGADSSARWSRRRFGKAALVATPVLATLYGRPLHAAANCTPSGWVSGNTSMHHEPDHCGGNTPGYWQGPASKMQNPGWDDIKDELLNSSHGFPGLDFYVGGVPATLQQTVEGPGRTPFDGADMLTRQLMRFGTAALLNARFIMAYSLQEYQVAAMVASAVLYGGYTSERGDYLSDVQVKAFLENTMDMPTWG